MIWGAVIAATQLGGGTQVDLPQMCFVTEFNIFVPGDTERNVYVPGAAEVNVVSSP